MTFDFFHMPYKFDDKENLRRGQQKYLQLRNSQLRDLQAIEQHRRTMQENNEENYENESLTESDQNQEDSVRQTDNAREQSNASKTQIIRQHLMKKLKTEAIKKAAKKLAGKVAARGAAFAGKFLGGTSLIAGCGTIIFYLSIVFLIFGVIMAIVYILFGDKTPAG